MARVAFLDCFSGVAGDMLLGALVDVGLPLEALRAELSRLPIGGYRLHWETVQRAGLRATRVAVEVEGEQPPRRLPDILAVIESSSLPEGDREKGRRVFRLLAEAEARVHGLAPEEVYLHEVGAVDALVDVMGAVAGLRLLGIERLYASPLPAPLGRRGELPLPAPATLELLARAGAPLRPCQGEGLELVTPTGAAIVGALAVFRQPAMRLRAVGYGAGAADLPGQPNVLRLWLGDEQEESSSLVLLETNLDDTTGELLAHALERLLSLGVNDAWLTPVQMKKGRPGVVLSVLCPEPLEEEAVRLILRETSTLGVRRQAVGRWEAERESLTFASSLGPAVVKVKRLPGEPPRAAPEFEDCRRLAQATGLPLLEVYRTVQEEAERLLREGSAPPPPGRGGRGGPSSARSPRRGRPSAP